jgi:hypothetical protein
MFITNVGTTPTALDLMTVEIPNYTATRPTIWMSGGTGASAYSSRWGTGSVASNITQVSFLAGTSWGTGAGTAYLYGVN